MLMDPLGVLFLPILGRSGQSPVLSLTENEGKLENKSWINPLDILGPSWCDS